MRRLYVHQFSCIDEATLELNQLTVLIGPQASGKSVLSKLVYFFYTLINDQFLLLQDGHDFSAFREHVRTKFIEWFPVSAWGSSKFSIEFTSGEYQVRVKRGVAKGAASGSMRLWFSPFFEHQYNETLQIISQELQRALKSEDSRAELETFWKTRDAATNSLAKRLGKDFVQSQLFVPAGRSFFTSVGRAVAAFEQAQILDPLTITFGRFFASFKDHRLQPWGRPSKARLLTPQLMEEVFGGELKSDRTKEYVQTKDGRKIPLSALSSGQQELLPLLLALDYWFERTRRGALIYIEEPEAHLFPSAQSSLIALLASMAMNPKGGSDLVLTTHSPYVLAKINNLTKAGEVAKRVTEGVQDKIAALIPRRSWITAEAVSAYAIHDRRLTCVTDPDGLINGEYLDSVSDTIAREFSALLAIEVEHAARS